MGLGWAGTGTERSWLGRSGEIHLIQNRPVTSAPGGLTCMNAMQKFKLHTRVPGPNNSHEKKKKKKSHTPNPHTHTPRAVSSPGQRGVCNDDRPICSRASCPVSRGPGLGCGGPSETRAGVWVAAPNPFALDTKRRRAKRPAPSLLPISLSRIGALPTGPPP